MIYHIRDIAKYGFLERGVWGQEQFYRLTEFAISLISRQKSDEINKFYLTPNFEIVAPMGTAPHLLFKLRELA